jgi:formiminotetrahydrofolate cyclodeaminase
MSGSRESIDASMREFLSALTAADAAHAVVSTTAVAGGLGTSLLLMVAALPIARSDSAVDRAALIEANTALTRTQEQLLETIETETVVRIYAARNMPQGNVTQQTEREAAIQLALRAAADVPLEVLRLCALSLKQAAIVAEHSSRAAANEVRLGVTLLRDAFIGAQANLEARLGSLTDVVYTQVIIEEVAQLNADAMAAAEAAERWIRPAPA